ncbi:G-protein coupled receptors family 1 profile domain-containing protein [Caenorhabditis elegans]|uniref:G-protein coupled receptors family 1 profile domain-containing protein n=1 Tax=Caenorhabditis elegans TaxID=6239 RepID=O45774_CAEEL|nr:G-protein coupled receptors family 1 profile domain-containing protein [Caenorhabditis elegans]CAB03333.1 G-protein coupled receptors family 1 profile domain-containing protein [Caenorhabditis elegans]|eukprot:NP_506783.1 Serpentine Receptor, class W [Caenorhabditis elegans]
MSDDEEFYSEDCAGENLFTSLSCGDIYRALGIILSDTNVFMQFFTVFINILHLIVLFQKELRTGAIYILMIGICLADIIGYLLDFFNVAYERTWISTIPFYTNVYCLRYDLVRVSFVDFVSIFVQMARPVAVWLAMMMALIRTLSVFFPMSIWIQKLAKAKTAIFMSVVVFTFWILWYSSQYFTMTLRWYPDVLSKACTDYEEHRNLTHYVLVVPKASFSLVFKREKLEPFIRFIPAILYPILTITLLVQLRIIKKKRESMNKNLLNDRSDNTTKLILFMTLFFMISEGLEGIGDYILQKILATPNYQDSMVDVISALGVAQYFYTNLRTLNGISHAFICFAMSSQYRDTVKRMLCSSKKQRRGQNILVISTVSVSSSHNSSRSRT